jgi:hypothetical protein
VGEVRGVRAGERDGVAVGGVGERQADRVQPLAGQAQPGGEHRVGAVQQVADARVPEGGHVDQFCQTKSPSFSAVFFRAPTHLGLTRSRRK